MYVITGCIYTLFKSCISKIRVSVGTIVHANGRYILNRGMFSESYLFMYIFYLFKGGGDRSGTVVKVLCYKSEGRWFDPS